MLDSRLIIDIIASVGTIISILFVLFTLFEMKKQRKLVCQPDLVISTLQYIGISGIYGLSDSLGRLPKASEWYSIKNKFKDTGSDRTIEIKLENISQSREKNVTYGFSGKDLVRFITKISKGDDNVSIENNKKDNVL